MLDSHLLGKVVNDRVICFEVGVWFSLSISVHYEGKELEIYNQMWSKYHNNESGVYEMSLDQFNNLVGTYKTLFDDAGNDFKAYCTKRNGFSEDNNIEQYRRVRTNVV